MWKKSFEIAGHELVIEGKDPQQADIFPPGFSAFRAIQSSEHTPLSILKTGVPLGITPFERVYSFQFEELNLNCEFAAGTEGIEFRMFPSASKNGFNGSGINLPAHPIILRKSRKESYCITNIHPIKESISEYNFLLWMAFGIMSVSKVSLAIHSSVIVYRGKAVLFIGESGTGKSTHTQLWLRNIPFCQILNDDSPILRIIENEPLCFGSPWSGKGGYYRNESFPVAAIVRLQQSPFNRIKKLTRIEAFAAVYPSCPPAFTIDAELTDHVCSTLSILLKKVPVYLLECLPDANAAALSCSTIFG